MIDLTEIKSKLETTGLPVAYRFFPEGSAPALPFITYYSQGASNFSADGKNYYTVDGLTVELYSRYKDLDSESAIETVLDSVGIWDKTETYIDSEKCYQIVYILEV